MNTKLRKDIASIASQLIAYYKPEKIILFGSAAGDEATEESDIDLFIVTKTPLPYYQRMTEVRNVLQIDRPLDVIVMTPEEFSRAQVERRLFIRQILKEGNILYATQ